MKIEIDLEVLIEHDLSADDYVFMKLIQAREFEMYSASAILPDFNSLKLSNWVTGDIDNIVGIALTQKGHMLLGLDAEKVNDFSIQFQRLFKNTAIGMMGDEFSVKQRLEWFKMKYNFSNETILTAAVRYIDSNRRDRFKYMMAADNFIRKYDPDGNPVSKLAAYCESSEDDLDTIQDGFIRM